MKQPDDKKAEQILITCDEAIYTMGLIMEMPAESYFEQDHMKLPEIEYYFVNNRVNCMRVLCAGPTIKDCLLKAKSLNWGVKDNG